MTTIEGGVIALVALPVLLIALLAGIARRRPAARVTTQVLFIMYGALLVGLVFFPLPVDGTCSSDPTVELVPFRTISLTLSRGFDTHIGLVGLGNLAAFVPMGLLVPLLVPHRPALPVGVLAGFVGSVLVEVCQFAISTLIGCGYRTTDIDDVILNTIGALGGAIGAWAILRLVGVAAFERRPRRRSGV